MSIPVDLEALHARIAEYGNTPFLVTVNGEGVPRIVSVTLRHEHGGLVVPIGRRSRTNVELNREVTLLWPPRLDPAYCMIVDATVVALDDGQGEITVEPRSAVLHRVGGEVGDRPV